jgi:hypothetical protein
MEPKAFCERVTSTLADNLNPLARVIVFHCNSSTPMATRHR